MGLYCEQCPEGAINRPALAAFGDCNREYLKQIKPIGPGNGCGAEGSILKFPDTHTGSGASFLSACDTHDQCYSDCKKSKQECDDEFLKDLHKACENAPNKESLGYADCRSRALLYYAGVANGGSSAFDAARKAHCKWTPCCGMYKFSDFFERA
jgi:secretory phospholipase A2